MPRRFTDRAGRVILLAEEVARSLNDDYVGTGHILVGIMKGGVGSTSAKALNNLDIDKVLPEIKKLVKIDGQIATVASMGNLPYSEKAQTAIEYADVESKKLGFTSIGTNHLLLALIAHDCVALKIIKDFDLTVEEIRGKVKSLKKGSD